MAVKATHPEYDKALLKWERCYDAYDGQDAVHNKRTVYLPKLKDQSDADYKSYLPVFFNATFRTVSGLKGLLTRKPFDVEADDLVIESFDNVSSAGDDLSALVFDVIRYVLTVGRVGLLVDFPGNNTAGLSVADAEALNQKPFIKTYRATDIINWRTSNVNNVEVLSMAVLKESEDVYKNEFEFKSEPRYRVLDLTNGVYRQRVFRINDKGEDVLLSEVFPVMNGANLTEIPFVIINSDSLRSCISEPPLIDLVNINMAHYKVAADYERGCHFTGLPTPIVAGYMPESSSDVLNIGSTVAWVFPSPDTKAYFLEFSGQGLQSLRDNLASKQEQMAILGARMLAAEKRMVETAETASIRQSSENSTLSSIGIMISKGIEKALNLYSSWLGSASYVEFELNKDFTGTPLSAQDLTALVSAWQSGAISQETLFNNLRSGELYNEDETFEDEQAKIDAQSPTSAAADRQDFNAASSAI